MRPARVREAIPEQGKSLQTSCQRLCDVLVGGQKPLNVRRATALERAQILFQSPYNTRIIRRDAISSRTALSKPRSRVGAVGPPCERRVSHLAYPPSTRDVADPGSVNNPQPARLRFREPRTARAMARGKPARLASLSTMAAACWLSDSLTASDLSGIRNSDTRRSAASSRLSRLVRGDILV